MVGCLKNCDFGRPGGSISALSGLVDGDELEVVVGVCDGSPQGLDSDPASATSDRFRSFAPFSS